MDVLELEESDQTVAASKLLGLEVAKNVGSTIHFILQGKGGVGKSYIASLLAQYYGHRDSKKPICIDTDPVNSTFASYKAYDVELLDIMSEHDIDPRAFDGLMERILPLKNETVIIDNGASSFVPLCSYLMDSQIINLLEDEGHTVLVHSVITGGQGFIDTTNGLASLIRNFESHGEIKIVVWQNEYFGTLSKGDSHFEETDFFKNRSDKFYALVKLAEQNRATFGRDIEDMVMKRLAFDEIMQDPDFSMMSKHRLKRVRDDIFESIERIEL